MIEDSRSFNPSNEGEELKISKRLASLMQPYLITSPMPSVYIPFGKCIQHVGVYQYQLGMEKCTYQIFSLWKINRYLPTYRGVHLSQKRSWYLNQINTAQITCRSKTGQITNDTAPQCYNEITAGNIIFQQSGINPGE